MCCAQQSPFVIAAADQGCALNPLRAKYGASLLLVGAPGPGATNGPHPGHMGPCFDAGPYPLRCGRLGPLWGPFCALRVRRLARCGCALRAAAASARRPRSARLAARFPPLPPLGHLCAAVAAPRALAGPVCLWPRPCCGAGFLFGRPSCARAWALCSACPAGGRLRPLRGKGRARSRPAPLRPLRAAFLGRGCGAFFSARGGLPPLAASGGGSSGGGCSWAALLGLRVRCWLGFAPAGAHRCSPRRASASVVAGFSPAAPPPLPPPPGARGEREAAPWGLPPPAVPAAPFRLAASAFFQDSWISLLTFQGSCDTMLLRGCAAPVRGPLVTKCPGLSEKALSKDRAFSFCPFPAAPGKSHI